MTMNGYQIPWSIIVQAVISKYCNTNTIRNMNTNPIKKRAHKSIRNIDTNMNVNSSVEAEDDNERLPNTSVNNCPSRRLKILSAYRLPR